MSSQLIPPDDFLDTDDPAAIETGLQFVDSIDVLQDYAAYENKNQKRTGILSMIQSRAAELRQSEEQ